MLNRALNWLTLAANAGGLGYWSVNVQSRLLWLSTEVRRMFDLEQETPVDADIMQSIHPDDRERVQQAYEHSVSSATPFDQEFRIATPNGSLRWLHSTGVVVENRGEFLGVTVDVTAKHRAGLASEETSPAPRVGGLCPVGELSGTVVHELRQPLASILLNARAAMLLLDSTTEAIDVSELRTILEEIVNADKRASLLMNRVRDLLRDDPLALEPVRLPDLIDEVLEMSRGDISSHGVTVQREMDDAVLPVLGDRVCLQQVLVNVIANACDAMDGKPAPERRLVIRTLRDLGDCTRVSICDTGSGFTVVPPDRVFEPFVTSKRAGLGLGLAICRKVIAAHGGAIWAEGNEFGGASFHVSIPAATAEVLAAVLAREPASFVARRGKLTGKASAARASRKLRAEKCAILAQVVTDRQTRAGQRSIAG
jgi:PAS domain S-box-containing protein